MSIPPRSSSVAQMNNPNIVSIYDSGEETVMTDNGGYGAAAVPGDGVRQGPNARDVIKANSPLSQT